MTAGTPFHVLALLLVWVLPLSAQTTDARVTARVEPARVPFGATVELVIEIDTPGARTRVEEPDLTGLPAVVVGQSRESQVTLDGGGLSRRLIYRYRLRPVAAGQAVIDPIRVVIDGRALYTPALEFHVDPGTLPGGGMLGRETDWGSGGPPPFLVTTRVDRERAVIGEQITLTFAFYHDPRAPLVESPDYSPPATPGFWRMDLDSEPRVSVERIGSRTYHVQRFRYALFGLAPGRPTIGPATVRLVEPDRERWWSGGETRVLKSDPLPIEIAALPSGAPAGFGGAVGRYTMAGGVERRHPTVGVPLELELTVTGIGNPTALGAPVLPGWPDVTVHPPMIDTETDVDDGVVAGSATFRYLLSPGTPGSLDLGTARYAYFDPVTGGYAVDSVALGEIEVLPAPPGSAPLAASPEFHGPTLWPAGAVAGPVPDGVAGEAWYWLALAGPWLAWLAVLGGRAVRHRTAGRAAPPEGGAGLVRARQALAAGRPVAVADGLRAIDRAVAERSGQGDVPPAVADARRQAREALLAGAYSGRGDAEVERALGRLEAALEDERRQLERNAGWWRTFLPVLVLIAAGGGSAAGAQAERGEAWRAANAAYRAGEFEQAARGFRTILDAGLDARAEANLAAALWREGERGRAVLHYHHALELAPREAVIAADLARLRDQLGDPPRTESAAHDLLATVRLDELLLALLGAGTLAFFVLVAGYRWTAGRVARVAGVALVVLLAGITALKAAVRERGERAVVVGRAAVRAASGGAVIAAIPEGSIVDVLERDPTGWRVRAPGIPAGWVAKDRIVPLHSGADHSTPSGTRASPRP